MSDVKVISTRRIVETLIRKSDTEQAQGTRWQRFVSAVSRYVTLQRQERE